MDQPVKRSWAEIREGWMGFDVPDAVEVKKTDTKGLGVFARRAIRKGELIERVPLLILSTAEYAAGVDQSLLAGYVFAWGDGEYALALGYGSLYNHSYRPNAVYEDDEPHRAKLFIAHRAIKLGEEITVNYNGSPTSRVRMWFEVAQESKPPRPRRKTDPTGG